MQHQCAGQRLLAEYRYEPPRVARGYANQTLYIDLSSNTITARPVDDQMKRTFIGGRGFGLWLLWQAVKDSTRWDDPENEVILASGPIGGTTTYPGAGKSIAVSISPLTGSVIDSNVGGYFGPLLKFAGWDAIEVQGIASEEVIVFIDGNRGLVQILAAPDEPTDSYVLPEQLVERFASSPEQRRAVSSVTAGPGAEHSLMGILNVSFYDVRRQFVRLKQAGRGGIGTVFRHKRIKALVVKYEGIKGDSNAPADYADLAAVGSKMHHEICVQDPVMNDMRGGGTTMLTRLMNDFDLLPVHNFRFGSHQQAPRLYKSEFTPYFSLGIPDGCWYGCTLACARSVDQFTPRTGPYKDQVVHVDAPEYETVAGIGSNCGIFDPHAVLEANFYCDLYGLDTISFGTSLAFAMECYEAGILNRERTGGLELHFGNADAMLEILHQIAANEGFGPTVGLGVRQMKGIFAEKYGADPQFLQDIGMECKGLEYSEYVSKESIAQQGGYGMANKGPQHDEAWLIFMDAINKQIPTFEDKAEALHYFPMFRTWFGLNGLCKLPWNDVEPADNKKKHPPRVAARVPEHVDNYIRLFRAVTGRTDVNEPEDLIRMSEPAYNLQRLFNLRMGFGTREHDAIPYRSMGPVTSEEYESRAERYDAQLKEAGIDATGQTTAQKVQLLRQHREQRYQQLVDAVYKRRGWTPEGIPTAETVRRLGIDFPDVQDLLRRHGVR
ncbi:MAG TPA: aldehyde ferredoxin oxidoreductase C-terminal domain-containing protein [Anaerolineae bacterium]|nr:aldehyde ferredoxin oxidoreductase C-terminal domain-containing protein [Anaerolineae bacterium]